MAEVLGAPDPRPDPDPALQAKLTDRRSVDDLICVQKIVSCQAQASDDVAITAEFFVSRAVPEGRQQCQS